MLHALPIQVYVLQILLHPLLPQLSSKGNQSMSLRCRVYAVWLRMTRVGRKNAADYGCNHYIESSLQENTSTVRGEQLGGLKYTKMT